MLNVECSLSIASNAVHRIVWNSKLSSEKTLLIKTQQVSDETLPFEKVFSAESVIQSVLKALQKRGRTLAQDLVEATRVAINARRWRDHTMMPVLHRQSSSLGLSHSSGERFSRISRKLFNEKQPIRTRQLKERNSRKELKKGASPQSASRASLNAVQNLIKTNMSFIFRRDERSWTRRQEEQSARRWGTISTDNIHREIHSKRSDGTQWWRTKSFGKKDSKIEIF